MIVFFWSLEMLDKSDPPTVPDGYGMSLAFLCLLDVVKSIQGLVQTPATGTAPTAPVTTEAVPGQRCFRFFAFS